MANKTVEKRLDDFFDRDMLIYGEIYSTESLIDKLKTKEGMREMQSILNQLKNELKGDK